MAICPGEEGDLGIMAGHTPLLTSLRSGHVELREQDQVIFKMNIQSSFGGFLHVTPKDMTITLDTFCPLCEDMDISGFDVMEKVMRIECLSCGHFKIETAAFDHMNHEKRMGLLDYIKNRPSAYVTKDVVQTLGGLKKVS